MAYFSPQFPSASPVLLMSPQPPHQSPRSMASFATRQLTPTRGFGRIAAGRKRCRDEASTNLEPDVSTIAHEEPETEWVYGPGMTLIKSTKAYVTEAGSQSGTWLEEKKAAEAAVRQEFQDLQRNHKTQRTDRTPVIDDFTLHLGIGWRKISEDTDIQAAARGWARFIENHFPISNARVVLESKGLQSYLVESTQGFFLFAENLRQGQLVSQTVDGALRNLQCSPPHFDGTEALSAIESPKLINSYAVSAATDTEMKMD
ncbi:hypothetical protein BGZ63DRAFT_366943 [Mariannaea sp. PMI_226]|nr:hypothetical protein BGZ63DRAFT_366943 [Mariannaea sp. PMI_226]